MKLQDLMEKRNKLTQEMRQLADNPKGSNGDLDSEQEQRFETLKNELQSVEKQLERQQLLDEAERRMEGQTVAGSGDHKFEEQAQRCSLLRAVGAHLDHSIDNGLEKEVSQELARKRGKSTEGILVPFAALAPQEQRAATVGGDAGNLVQTDVMANQFIDALRANTVAMSLGAQTVTGLTGDIAIPKMDASTPAAEWVAENVALTGGDHSFTQLSASPKTVGALTEWSRKVFLQSSMGMENLVRNDFTKKTGAALDLAILNGSGDQPEGILQKSGINSVSGSDPATYAECVNAVGKVKEADAMSSSMGWAAHAAHYATYKAQLKESGDAGAGYILDANDRIAGYPVQFTSQMPTNSSPAQAPMLFGSWDQVLVMFWGSESVEFLLNPYSSPAYEKGNLQLRAFLDCDMLVRHEEAFTELTGTSV